MSINSSKVRSIVKFGFGCLMVDGLIELATSYEARSAYEFADLMAMRSRARKANISLQPMTREELWERARCNVGTLSIAKRDLRKEGKHSALMTTRTFAKDADGHYIETKREVSNFVGGLTSAKEFIESECARKDDGRVVSEHSRNDDYAFIFFDGEKPNAWTDAISYELKII
jgi:hypothetical protein